MKNITLSARKEYSSILRFIEQMLHLLLASKERDEKAKKLREKLQLLDDSNREFYDILHDTRENNKMLLYLIVASFSILIDFFLLYNAISLLCSQFHLPWLLKAFIPLLLVAIEIGISYSSILKIRSGEYVTRIRKYLPYFVILVLIAFSVMIISFALQGYNSHYDGGSIWIFLFSSAVLQIVLLIPSILLHIWIIRHAEDIAEAIAYYKYKSNRYALTQQIEQIETDNKKKHWILFVKWAHNLMLRIDAFKRNYPELDAGFERTMPEDLIKAINYAMGRSVIQISSGEIVK